jgi:hypothetical protein
LMRGPWQGCLHPHSFSSLVLPLSSLAKSSVIPSQTMRLESLVVHLFSRQPSTPIKQWLRDWQEQGCSHLSNWSDQAILQRRLPVQTLSSRCTTLGSFLAWTR